MPLDLYVIRHGESENESASSRRANRATTPCIAQDNVTVPDRSWRLTATGRKQADCIGRWLVSQQLFDRYMVSPYVRTPRNRSHHGPAQGQMGGEPCAARTFLG